jgi:sugar/nucleoside kinase (ribokinase family)
MNVSPIVVSAGYMPLDIIATPSGTIARQAGGTAANLAAILAFLGWDAILAGQNGADVAGDEFIEDLCLAGVDVNHVHRPEESKAPRLVHSVQPEGHSYSYSCPTCESRFPRSRPLTIEQAQQCAAAHPDATVFFFDRANAGTLTLAEHYAERGSIVVFEPSVPVNAEMLARSAAVAHVIKHSDDRSVGGLDHLHVQPGSEQIRIVTHGAEGLELRIGKGPVRRLPALRTLAADAGGAGDWTTAGFLAKAVRGGAIRGEELEDGLRFGQALAALNCATPGARGLMRLTRETVLRRAKSVLAEGGLFSKLRLPAGRPASRPSGACPMCLMPLSYAVSISEEEATSVAVGE